MDPFFLSLVSETLCKCGRLIQLVNDIVYGVFIVRGFISTVRPIALLIANI